MPGQKKGHSGQKRQRSGRLWGTRFKSPPHELMREFNDSLAFDHELIEEEIEVSTAWAECLEQAKVISTSERKALARGLREILDEAQRGHGAPNTEFEDIHSFVEASLVDKLGDVARKLHTGRSRNDLVATDLKLYLKRAIEAAREMTLDLTAALAERAMEESATPMPGYTHLKQAEPITFGHWCLACVQMLIRDVDRLAATSSRHDECPLGSGALAGTPLAIDRKSLAKRLGFAGATSNSLDAAADRDMAIEYLFDAALLLGHLSRLAEDLVFLSSDEVAFVELPDALATGSSRLPHKKNPDVLELVRGHAARAIGELSGLLALVKGLPLSYNKDLQLDKEPVFRMRVTLSRALPTLTALVRGIRIDRARMREVASRDVFMAAELTDALADRGVPYRDAHEIVGRRVATALDRHESLRELGATREITSADLQSLDVERAIRRKNALGGTSPPQVVRSAKRALRAIERLRSGSRRRSGGASWPG
jgi:argininosuccinate lyase/amino-acid N-acetyltransferase